MATTRGGVEQSAPEAGRAEAIIREVIAGDKRGAVRRIVLYVTLFGALAVGFYLPPALIVATGAGVLLLSTDVLL